jgi:hypothetical protein
MGLKIYFSLLLWLMLSLLMLGITTLVLHEAGHAFIGMLLECKDIKIVLFDFSKKAIYTEMKCMFLPPMFIIIGPFVFTLPLSLLFLFLEKFQPEKYFSLVIVGFLLMSLQEDLNMINIPTTYQILVQIIGIIILVVGEGLIINLLFKKYLGI